MTDKKAAAFLRGTIAENPVMILFMGMCTALSATSHVIPALAIGTAALLVMLLSNAVMCALRGLIPQSAKLPACMIVTAFFVSAAQMIMNAYLPDVYQMLGVYLAVVAVNLVVVGEAEASVSGRSFGASMAAALINGLGLTAALFVMAAIREILGCGSFAGKAIPFFANYNVPALAQAPGGLLVFGALLAAISKICPAKKAHKGAASAAAGVETCED